MTRSLAPGLAAIGTELVIGAGPSVTARAVHLWSTVIGAVSLEVFGQFGARDRPRRRPSSNTRCASSSTA